MTPAAKIANKGASRTPRPSTAPPGRPPGPPTPAEITGLSGLPGAELLAQIRNRPPFRPGLDPVRDLVMDHLTRQVERYPMFDLRPLRDDGLEPRDAALAHAIVDATMRRWLTLGYLIEKASGRPFAGMQPPLRGALLAGATQMLLLDSIPPYAAINHAVEWMKVAISVGAGGMANAVLRKISRLKPMTSKVEDGAWDGGRDTIPITDCTHLRLPAEVLPELPAQRLSIASSVPMAVLRRWIERWGPEKAQHVALHALARAPIVLSAANPAEPPDATGLLDGSVILPHACEGSYVFSGTRGDMLDLLAGRADVWVQDPASRHTVQTAAGVLAGTVAATAGKGGFAARKPETVRLIVDLCAGLGTKTRQLTHLYPNARVVACDPDERRLALMRSGLKDLASVHIVRDDQLEETVAAEAGALGLAGADLVLLDVPCSNSGVLARRPEAKYRMNEESLASLVGLQRTIIARGRAIMAPGAGSALVYCTCSVEEEENEQQVAAMEQQHGLVCVFQQQKLPEGLGADAPDKGVTYSDGSFVSVMVNG